MVNFFANLLGVSHIFISSGQLDTVLSIIIGVSLFRRFRSHLNLHLPSTKKSEQLSEIEYFGARSRLTSPKNKKKGPD